MDEINEIQIGDVVKLKKKYTNVYFSWEGGEPKRLVVLDVIEFNDSILVKVDKKYKTSEGEENDIILFNFLEKDITETRNKNIDDILDNE